jgi:hypothetical protein
MKLFCILMILVFAVILGVYYTVIIVQEYQKFAKKMKKKP